MVLSNDSMCISTCRENLRGGGGGFPYSSRIEVWPRSDWNRGRFSAMVGVPKLFEIAANASTFCFSIGLDYLPNLRVLKRPLTKCRLLRKLDHVQCHE